MTRLPFPLVLALCVLCLVLGVTGGAVAGAKITGKQIKNESVTGKDIKDRSLSSKDFSAGAASSLQGPPGPAGAQGPKGNNGTNGINGTPGTNGTDGVSGWEMVSATVAITSGNDDSVSKSCTGTRKLLGATGNLTTVVHPVTVVYDDSNTASAFTKDVPSNVTLKITIVCANVS
jgi:hypothetical protein